MVLQVFFSQMDSPAGCISHIELFLLLIIASGFPCHISTHQVLLKVLRKTHLSRYQTYKILQGSTETGVSTVLS